MVLAFASTALAGYYGREWQDVIDRNAANPIGPYEVRWVDGGWMKTHPRTGRMWVFFAKKPDLQWVEFPQGKSIAAGKN